ncbi:MAG: hypothetical protein V8Q84_12795 [Bilophila sp.]
MCVTLDAGVITQTAIDAVSREGFLFTVDPASKTASTIGGNVAEIWAAPSPSIRGHARQPALVAHGHPDRGDHHH